MRKNLMNYITLTLRFSFLITFYSTFAKTLCEVIRYQTK
jgi:hypothetical protein